MFDPIAFGSRGPAVEDVQKRLLTLGFDLGPTGVDGVFGPLTHAAVQRFQDTCGLSLDGIVTEAVWAALVDATFQLGDRLLYLKVPYFHGADVALLQGALNILGFAAGEPDGIFGAFTERAVREFQTNIGLPADGIAGPETVRAIERLRYVWQDKDPSSPAVLSLAPARAASVLKGARIGVICLDSACQQVGERFANLARAAEPAAQVMSVTGRRSDLDLVLFMTADHAAAAVLHMPTIMLSAESHAPGRFITAFQDSSEATIVVSPSCADCEYDAQATAVWILDGVCAVLATAQDESVVP